MRKQMNRELRAAVNSVLPSVSLSEETAHTFFYARGVTLLEGKSRYSYQVAIVCLNSVYLHSCASA